MGGGVGLLEALGAGALVGGGLFVAVLAIVGLPERAAGRPSAFSTARSAGSTASRRLLWGGGVGVIVLLLTRWPVAAIGVGLLVAFWDRIAGGGAAEKQSILRIEALAIWTESLRDTIAGAIGLEQAIPATANTAAPVLRPSLNLLVDRLRIREPLPDALMALAKDVDDPSADVVCAALVLNARLRGPGLRDVLTALANSIREELDMRRRIEASRRSIRRSVQIVLIIVLGVMGLLSVLNRQYVAPYSGVAGQLALFVVILLFGAGLMWLRRLASTDPVGRFLVMDPTSVGGEDERMRQALAETADRAAAGPAGPRAQGAGA